MNRSSSRQAAPVEQRQNAGQTVALAFWGTLIVGCVVAPLLAPGILAHRDMLVLDQPGLIPGALGFGDLPARNVPQDGLLAVVGAVVPASWFARVLIAGGATLGVVGSAMLAKECGATGPAVGAAMLVGGLNPGVVERLLQGQWSLAIAIWVLPLICWAFLRGRMLIGWALLVPASLTPSGAILAGLVAGVTHHAGLDRSASGRTAHTRASSGEASHIARHSPWLTWLLAIMLSLPWLVPALVAAVTGHGVGSSAAESAAVFAPRAEEHLGTLGTLLTFGGLWNGAAVPASRGAGFGIFGLALAVLSIWGWRAVPRALRWLALGGLMIACTAWLLPGWFSWAVSTLPGGGLLRDSHKFIFLALPAAIAGIGAIRRPLAWLALLLAVVQAWDFPRELRALSPVPDPLPAISEEINDTRDVLVLGAETFALVDGVPTVNPWDKALPTVQSGEIRVGEHTVDEPSPRHRAAVAAWREQDRDRLAELGVGWVVHGADGTVHADTAASAPPRWPVVTGLFLLTLWAAAVPLVWLVCVVRCRRRR